MFKQGPRVRAPIDINDVIREVLAILDVDLRAQTVSVSTTLHPAIPHLLADRGQL
jgi:hypothetical protein